MLMATQSVSQELGSMHNKLPIAKGKRRASATTYLPCVMCVLGRLILLTISQFERPRSQDVRSMGTFDIHAHVTSFAPEFLSNGWAPRHVKCRSRNLSTQATTHRLPDTSKGE